VGAMLKIPSMAKTFSYRALDNNGRLVKGKIVCNNREKIFYELQKQNLTLLETSYNFFSFLNNKGLSKEQLMTFTQNLQFLLQADVPLIQALKLICKRNNSNTDIFHTLYFDVKNGMDFSKSLQKFPHIFDTVYVTLIKVGENSTKLAKILYFIVAILKQESHNKKQLKKILMTPVISFVTIMSVFIFLLWYLVPNLVSFITSFDIRIPLYTRLLISLSQYIKDYALGFFAVSAFLVFFYYILRKNSKKIQLAQDKLVLKLPIIGEFAKEINFLNFFYCLDALYNSGHSFADGIVDAKNVINNLYLQKLIITAGKKINDGTPVDVAFAKIVDDKTLIALQVGLKSTNISLVMCNIVELYQQQLQDKVDKMHSLLPPMLTIVLGIMIGWIMLSILLPIYDVILVID
jgi:type IV pilus assembly protein PilC